MKKLNKEKTLKSLIKVLDSATEKFSDDMKKGRFRIVKNNIGFAIYDAEFKVYSDVFLLESAQGIIKSLYVNDINRALMIKKYDFECGKFSDDLKHYRSIHDKMNNASKYVIEDKSSFALDRVNSLKYAISNLCRF